MAQPIIEFKHVAKQYDDTVVLKSVDLEIEAGKFYTLLGPSGSGQTTILRLIAGFLEASSGDILFEGERINDVPAEKRRVNTVFQNYALFPNMNVFENVAFGMSIKGKPKNEIKAKVAEMLELVKLGGYEDREISELSGGQKRRVSIGIELLSPSPYFILDEPSSGLDALSDRNLLRTLKILAKSANKSIVVITHNTENLAIFDKIIFLSKGRPTFAGTYEELLLEYKTSDPYMIRKYMDMNIADVYQELNASTRIYKI